MSVKVKICGLMSRADVKMCAANGADFIGFVFAKSPRRITKEQAGIITGVIPPEIKKAGVFVNEEEKVVRDIAEYCGLDVLQFHGEETPDYCSHFGGFEVFKAFRLKDEKDLMPIPSYDVSAFLLDAFVEGAYGGTGKTFNWELAVEAKKFGKPIVLSGGLNPENVGGAIMKVKPEMVDVSSGVESAPGKKDPDKVREFVEKVRSCKER